MRWRLNTLAVSGLQWALGLVVLLESLHFALSRVSAHHFAQTGLSFWLRPALAWSEAAAAVLFLVPATTLVGGFALLAVFAAAIAIHIHLGDYGVGMLIVYGMAVVVCMTQREKKAGGKVG